MKIKQHQMSTKKKKKEWKENIVNTKSVNYMENLSAKQ